MKLIVAGSRHFTDISRYDVTEFIGHFGISNISEVVSGACHTGPDAAAFWYAGEMVIPLTEFPAEWDKYGRRAGPLRNKKMAIYGDALLLIWDGQSPGSNSMKTEMLNLNKPVYEVILRTYNEKK